MIKTIQLERTRQPSKFGHSISYEPLSQLLRRIEEAVAAEQANNPELKLLSLPLLQNETTAYAVLDGPASKP